ncbi:MAG: biopolymer transporter ExbD [Nitrosomonas sp.]|uniref:ExbD/TolR family protein n=1 Tax=Nitrosomonas sp. TaxID=42353 RepID=UPI0032ED1C45
MAFGGGNSYQDQKALSEINVVPLVDVMLVLLIIFIITAPLLTHSVKIDLPKASSEPSTAQPEPIEFAIQANGEFFWNGETVAPELLMPRFMQSAENSPHTELHIRADKMAHYEHVARVMSMAAKAGLTKIGFITDPAIE